MPPWSLGAWLVWHGNDMLVSCLTLDDQASHYLALNDQAPHSLTLNDQAPHSLTLNDQAPHSLTLTDQAPHSLTLNDQAPHSLTLNDQAPHLTLLLADTVAAKETIALQAVHNLCTNNICTAILAFLYGLCTANTVHVCHMPWPWDTTGAFSHTSTSPAGLKQLKRELPGL